jgi:hypothetical protein
MAEDDPHLFSSLINLPTFATNGEKVRFFKFFLRKMFINLLTNCQVSMNFDLFKTEFANLLSFSDVLSEIMTFLDPYFNHFLLF